MFTPTLILTGALPVLSTILGNFAEKLTEAENYQTNDGKKLASSHVETTTNLVASSQCLSGSETFLHQLSHLIRTTVPHSLCVYAVWQPASALSRRLQEYSGEVLNRASHHNTKFPDQPRPT